MSFSLSFDSSHHTQSGVSSSSSACSSSSSSFSEVSIFSPDSKKEAFLNLSHDHDSLIMSNLSMKDLLSLRSSCKKIQAKVDEFLTSQILSFSRLLNTLPSSLESIYTAKKMLQSNSHPIEKAKFIFQHLGLKITGRELWNERGLNEVHNQSFSSLHAFASESKHLEQDLALIDMAKNLTAPGLNEFTDQLDANLSTSEKAQAIRTWLEENQRKFDRIVSFSCTGLKILPPEIKYFRNLERINLTECGLTKLPPEIGSFEKLTALSLADNKLESLPPEIANLQNLRVLHLEKNQFKQFPAEILDLPNLSILGLGSNQVDRFPDISSFPMQKSLRALDLTNNQIKELPENWFNQDSFSELRILRLDGNQLENLPEEINQLKSLEVLSLTKNQITSIPKGWSRLEALVVDDIVIHSIDVFNLNEWIPENCKIHIYHPVYIREPLYRGQLSNRIICMQKDLSIDCIEHFYYLIKLLNKRNEPHPTLNELFHNILSTNPIIDPACLNKKDKLNLKINFLMDNINLIEANQFQLLNQALTTNSVNIIASSLRGLQRAVDTIAPLYSIGNHFPETVVGFGIRVITLIILTTILGVFIEESNEICYDVDAHYERCMILFATALIFLPIINLIIRYG